MNLHAELVGLFFWGRVPINETLYTTRYDMVQGRVLSKLGEGYYLVEHHSFATGQPKHAEICNLDDMAGWQFFADPDDVHKAKQEDKACWDMDRKVRRQLNEWLGQEGNGDGGDG